MKKQQEEIHIAESILKTEIERQRRIDEAYITHCAKEGLTGVGWETKRMGGKSNQLGLYPVFAQKREVIERLKKDIEKAIEKGTKKDIDEIKEKIECIKAYNCFP